MLHKLIVLLLLVSVLCKTRQNTIISTGYSIVHDKTSSNDMGYITPGLVSNSHVETSNVYAEKVLYGNSNIQMTGGATCAIPPLFCINNPYRSFDGSCNHLEEPKLGMANTTFSRLLSPLYGDDISLPTTSSLGLQLPNARQISIELFGEMPVPDPQFTLLNMQWGQILTHDMSLQAGGTQSKKHPTRCCTDDGRLISSGLDKTCYAIIIPPNDPIYSQAGIQCFNFVRTLTDLDANCRDNNGYADQLTTVTAYMDLSLVYGNSIQQSNDLREFRNGRLLAEERNNAEWLPSSRNVTGDCDVLNLMEVCYRAGDSRVNQNPGLSILQTILLREHNRIADNLAKLNPHWDDNILFEEARKINIAQYQHINYYEWLPIFLGWDNMIKNRLIYKTSRNRFINDYNPRVDPSILNSHATAAFRYFHTQIEGRLDLLSEVRTIVGSLRLSDWFNRPGIIESGDNFDALTRGHTTQPEDITDININREVKHYLFRRNMQFGTDLKAFDIQRNRDHGLASYNDYRHFCGLRRAQFWEDFSDLISLESIEKMKMLYETPDDVDLTVGGALEVHVVGALAGPTFLCILTEQFYRTRVGDRFFYENGDKHTGFTPYQLAEIRKVSMARLLCDNGNNINSMQSKAFLLISDTNPVISCSDIPEVDLSKWAENDYFTNIVPPFFFGK